MGVYNNILMRLTDIENLKKEAAEADAQAFMHHVNQIERIYKEVISEDWRFNDFRKDNWIKIDLIPLELSMKRNKNQWKS